MTPSQLLERFNQEHSEEARQSNLRAVFESMGAFQSYQNWLDRMIEHCQMQHDDLDAGKFGPERMTPENLAFWRGRITGLQEASDELIMRLECALHLNETERS